MKIPFFSKPKPVQEEIPLPDDSALKFVKRTIELSNQGKLEWRQEIPISQNRIKYSEAYVANYKDLKVIVICGNKTVTIEIRNKNNILAFTREIRHPQTKKNLENAVWENSIAKKFLDSFLES